MPMLLSTSVKPMKLCIQIYDDDSEAMITCLRAVKGFNLVQGAVVYEISVRGSHQGGATIKFLIKRASRGGGGLTTAFF